MKPLQEVHGKQDATYCSRLSGTPSTEILETIAFKYRDIKAQWSQNEKVALEGCSRGICGRCKSSCNNETRGIKRCSRSLFTFSYTGVNGGLVIINADDPGAWSSQNEQDNRHLARAAKVPMLDASSPSEAKEFTKLAFDISEKFDRPVIVRITTRVAHSQGIVNLEEKQNIPLKDFVRDPKKYVMIPAHARPRHVFIEEQIIKLKEYSTTSGLNFIEWKNKKRGIIANGVAYQYVKEVCSEDSILKIGMVWPLPDDLIKEFASQVEELYVVEELDPFIEDYVKSLGFKVKGKEIIPLLESSPLEIVE
jgi:indolepyruvate ferredoxin oxidoreductase alpha subunit